jgi:hypothetical protein
MAHVTDRVDIKNVDALASDLRDASARNSRWRREECVNLIPSAETSHRHLHSWLI